ncbi:hypothetical protein RhiJN_01441 [Ceratobasidium sp. AG-Ba]|nr:hypothetical protein RhiJN_01441 [Ceratobasidium sp. AG-Ba]
MNDLGSNKSLDPKETKSEKKKKEKSTPKRNAYIVVVPNPKDYPYGIAANKSHFKGVEPLPADVYVFWVKIGDHGGKSIGSRLNKYNIHPSHLSQPLTITDYESFASNEEDEDSEYYESDASASSDKSKNGKSKKKSNAVGKLLESESLEDLDQAGSYEGRTSEWHAFYASSRQSAKTIGELLVKLFAFFEEPCTFISAVAKIKGIIGQSLAKLKHNVNRRDGRRAIVTITSFPGFNDGAERNGYTKAKEIQNSPSDPTNSKESVDASGNMLIEHPEENAQQKEEQDVLQYVHLRITWTYGEAHTVKELESRERTHNPDFSFNGFVLPPQVVTADDPLNAQSLMKEAARDAAVTAIGKAVMFVQKELFAAGFEVRDKLYSESESAKARMAAERKTTLNFMIGKDNNDQQSSIRMLIREFGALGKAMGHGESTVQTKAETELVDKVHDKLLRYQIINPPVPPFDANEITIEPTTAQPGTKKRKELYEISDLSGFRAPLQRSKTEGTVVKGGMETEEGKIKVKLEKQQTI